MKQCILVLGWHGNMGRRYGSILDHLGVEWHGLDLDEGGPRLKYITGVIIATPTDTHLDLIEKYKDFPILCEKAITRFEFDRLESVCKSDIQLRMINQYEYYTLDCYDGRVEYYYGDDNHTLYDYYNSGADGLYWDCINIIGMAAGPVSLNRKNPKWLCRINGGTLQKDHMDDAYLWNVKDWLQKYDENRDYILFAHNKVRKMEKDAENRIRNSG